MKLTSVLTARRWSGTGRQFTGRKASEAHGNEGLKIACPDADVRILRQDGTIHLSYAVSIGPLWKTLSLSQDPVRVSRRSATNGRRRGARVGSLRA